MDMNFMAVGLGVMLVLAISTAMCSFFQTRTNSHYYKSLSYYFMGWATGICLVAIIVKMCQNGFSYEGLTGMIIGLGLVCHSFLKTGEHKWRHRILRYQAEQGIDSSTEER